MAIQWGAWHGHLRVGIEVGTTPFDTFTPSVTVLVGVYVQCDSSWNFADNQTVTLTGSLNKTFNFYNGLGPNQVMQVGGGDIFNQVQSYGGGPDYWFEARLSGAYNGAAPAVGVGYRLPARPPFLATPPSTGPAFRNVTSTGVFFDWGQPTSNGGSALIEDNLQVSLNEGFTNLVHDSYAPGTERQVNGLRPSTRYWARARVRNGVGWSGWSAVTTGVTAGQVPAPPPAGPTWSDVRADGALLQWPTTLNDGGLPLIEDQLQVSANSAFTALVYDKVAPGSVQRVTGGLAPNTPYWSRSRVRNSAGWSGWSATTSARTNPFKASPPVVEDSGPDRVRLRWGAPGTTPAPTRYELQVWKDPGTGMVRVEDGSLVSSAFFAADLRTIPTTATSLEVTGLVPGVKYLFRVRAGTSLGWGVFSDDGAAETASGAKVRRNGAWVDAPAHVRIGGQWRIAKVHKRRNGTWVL